MIVREMIEWLKAQPQDATVEVIIHSSGRTYYDQGGAILNGMSLKERLLHLKIISIKTMICTS